MTIGLSVVVITFNEEKNLDRCLESVQKIADEIVVVDSFSTDQTATIAKKHGAKFIQHRFEGHIQQKNYAIDQSTNDWILSLDADEALTPELEASILEMKQGPQKNGYRMNRLTNYCGHWVKHCGWYPDTKVRLIKKSEGRWCGENPHDRLDMHHDQDTALLSGDLLHYSYYSKEDHFKQIEYFGDIAARELHRKGKRTNWLEIAVKTAFQLFKSLLLKSGWRDGKTGVLISFRSAYATYRKYRKLYALQ